MSVISDNYQLAFDEINSLAKAIYYTSENVQDDVLSLLIKAYELGNKLVNEQLDYEMYVDLELMNKSIFERFDDKTFADRANEYMQNDTPGKMVTLLESEFHRVFCQAELDTAMGINKYIPINKTWNTELDDRVRDTHVGLEGISIPVDNNFVTYDGDYALQPGGFTKVENNANCRCLLDFEFA